MQIEDTGIRLQYSREEVMQLAGICSQGIGMRIEGWQLLERFLNEFLAKIGPGNGVTLTSNSDEIETIKNSGRAIAMGIAFARKE